MTRPSFLTAIRGLFFSGLITMLPALHAAERNRFFFGPTVGLNISAEFGGQVPAVVSGNPGPIGAGEVDRFYHDGYVRLDSSGNAGGYSWYWGYDNRSQVFSGTKSELAFVAQSTASLSAELKTERSLVGMELIYQREVFSAHAIRAGVQGGFRYLPFNFTAQRHVASEMATTRDRYALYENVIPLAPYYGGFEGPGLLIPSTPFSRTEQMVPATVTHYRELEGDIFTIKLGPFIAWMPTEKFEVGLAGGLLIAPTHYTFAYRDIHAPSARNHYTMETAGRLDKSDVLLGGSVELTLEFTLTPAISVAATGQYQFMDDLGADLDGRTGKISLGDSVFISLGVAFRF
jgi:hypothetical protein